MFKENRRRVMKIRVIKFQTRKVARRKYHERTADYQRHQTRRHPNSEDAPRFAHDDQKNRKANRRQCARLIRPARRQAQKYHQQEI